MDFITQQFSNGLCYPVWLDDDGLVIQIKPKQASLDQANSELAFSYGNDRMAGLSEAFSSSQQESPTARGRTQLLHCNDFESRDVGSDIGERCPVPGEFVRGIDVSDSLDLDDVISKIVRKRDELLKANTLAGEEITRLKLENENLRNLNAIGKRITNSQQDEITKLKLELVKSRREHQEKVDELNEMINKLKNRSLYAQFALDDGVFWNSPSNVDSTASKENDEKTGDTADANATTKSGDNHGILGSLFEWKVRD